MFTGFFIQQWGTPMVIGPSMDILIMSTMVIVTATQALIIVIISSLINMITMFFKPTGTKSVNLAMISAQLNETVSTLKWENTVTSVQRLTETMDTITLIHLMKTLTPAEMTIKTATVIKKS